jgi:hypothetical protein
VGEPATLPRRLLIEAGGSAVVLGVDLPLGLPRAFVRAHALRGGFPSFLRGLRPDDSWFEVCGHLDDVAAGRPFYPRRGAAGMTRASHARALGLPEAAALSRLCDLATSERPAGAPLFWTLGANQTGKAALAGWRDMLIPCLAGADPPRLWPFEGDLDALVAPGGVVIAETYPAEAARQLGVRLSGSKQRQADRAAAGASLRAAMRRLDAVPTPALAAAIDAGFAGAHGADDGFDSVLGVLCVLGVLAGHRPGGLPPALRHDRWIRDWEGWVLGQTALPANPFMIDGDRAGLLV